ncbi:hypothetical protein GQS52_02625 [Streptomyces sp. SCUT-3]|uniref:hypothetical protein n=1 Tax=Streptomyces TaxID=1883 RepID=UPI0015F7909E|nr:hypothetical protein [Streptomyces sp. SCUT-3]QMV20864.1 hypothetical protein GQS52_02625 [Streptomyces sp. SCUT-3]
MDVPHGEADDRRQSVRVRQDMRPGTRIAPPRERWRDPGDAPWLQLTKSYLPRGTEVIKVDIKPNADASWSEPWGSRFPGDRRSGTPETSESSLFLVEYFPLGLTMESPESKVDLRTSLIPSIDFAMIMSGLRKAAQRDASCRLELTISQIEFSTEFTGQEITFSVHIARRDGFHTTDLARMTRANFITFATETCQKCVDLIISHQPRVSENPSFKKYVEIMGLQIS